MRAGEKNPKVGIKSFRIVTLLLDKDGREQCALRTILAPRATTTATGQPTWPPGLGRGGVLQQWATHTSPLYNPDPLNWAGAVCYSCGPPSLSLLIPITRTTHSLLELAHGQRKSPT